ncbi:MAG: peptidoglycan DD-metalloendopeptidase family protein [Propioniciclava sp.]
MRALVVAAAAALALVAGLTAPAPAWASPTTQPPLPGPVVREFNPPAQRWAAGHRGVDIAGQPGEAVMAPAAGTVTFAGDVAGRPVVVISHGERRSTLEPVRASVRVGQRVAAGDVVGLLAPGHGCPAPSCVHWGVRAGDTYLDPLSFLGVSEVRLLPADAAAAVEARARTRALAGTPPVAVNGNGVLGSPAHGRLTSGFGPRFHPIFHEWRPHQGVDISAPCGTPIRAAADGVVSHAAWDSSGGWRLIVDHGRVRGVALQTGYLHAQGYTVRPGQRVHRGEQVGTVGSTGWSTGCHLHFSVKVNGSHVDPETWW